MNQLSFHPFNILFFRNLGNFTKINLIKGFFGALVFALAIYLEYFSIENKLLYTIIVLFGFYILLKINQKELLVFGFFTGVFWFWWIGISFIYYELIYLIPLVVLFFGFFYGFIFYIFGFFDKFNMRFLAIFLFGFVEPFGFNWFKLEILFVNSWFIPSSMTLFLVLLIMAFVVYFESKIRKILLLVFFIPLTFVIQTQTKEPTLPPIKIKLTDMNVPQNLKWQKEYTQELLGQNFALINKAIDEDYDVVVLPEATFALALNTYEDLMEELKKLSFKIDIVAGGLYYDGSHFNNSTYFISKGSVQVANKMVLVPFGEKIPLPQILVELINEIFYDGASDFIPASTPTDFEINGFLFRNAICYEATSKELFVGNPKYMIATSNNAWFTPSIQPSFQKLLMKYYAHKYNTIIYSVANGSKSEIILF